MLDTRRDFTLLRNMSQTNNPSEQNTDSRRVVFLVSDDFDLFNIDEEVIYDSAAEDIENG